MAEQHSEHLGRLAKVLLIPLDIPDQQLCESCKTAVHVESEHAIEHIHTVRDLNVLDEVAVWVGSKNGRMANLLTGCGHVVSGGSGRCSRHRVGSKERMNRRAW